MGNFPYVQFSDLVGKTIKSIDGLEKGSELIRFTMKDGYVYSAYNSEHGTGNDCSVDIDDVCGDISDIIGTEIISAYESSNDKPTDKAGTWTFYHISTRRGSITIKWYGESNGYYSERAYFERIK